MKTKNDGGETVSRFTFQWTVDSCFLDQTVLPRRKRRAKLMPLFFSSFFGRGRGGGGDLRVRFTNRIQKWKNISSLYVMMMRTMTRAKQYIQELSIQHFVTMVWWCSSRVQLGQQYNSLVTLTMGEKKKLPSPSAPLGGDMPLWARLHRNSLTQLSCYRIATEHCFEECRLTSWISEKKKPKKQKPKRFVFFQFFNRLSPFGFKLSFAATVSPSRQRRQGTRLQTQEGATVKYQCWQRKLQALLHWHFTLNKLPHGGIKKDSPIYLIFIVFGCEPFSLVAFSFEQVDRPRRRFVRHLTAAVILTSVNWS